MSAVLSVRVPSYRLHKPTGQAVVTLHGEDIYLGRHDSPESRAEYLRRVGGERPTKIHTHGGGV